MSMLLATLPTPSDAEMAVVSPVWAPNAATQQQHGVLIQTDVSQMRPPAAP